MGLIHLVRHGQASAGTHDYDRLSTIGQRQSQLLGQWWASHGFRPEIAIHGTLRRQMDTASAALGGLTQPPDTEQDSRLNEYDHRIIESHFSSDRASYTPESMTFDDYLDVMTRWRDHTDEAGAATVEPWADFRQRGLRAIEAAGGNGERSHTVLFTSGGVIATTLASVLQLDFEHTIDAIWRIRNGSITSFHQSSRGLRLVEFNAVPHLLEQREPSLITLI